MTSQPEKTFQPLKSIFFKEHRRDVLGKGTSPVLPKSRIGETSHMRIHDEVTRRKLLQIAQLHGSVGPV